MSSSDCRITIERVGARQLRLSVAAPPLGPAPRPFTRKVPDLSPETVALLRWGTPPVDVVDEVATRVSEWLQKPDLDLPVVLGFADGGDERWRIVFHVPGEPDGPGGRRFDLIDVPIELICATGDTPLVLHRRVSSIVHLLDKVGHPPTATSAWPLRVLLVRANPPDLGGGVPEAGPIRTDIMALQPDWAAQSLVQVDVLSGEKPDLPGLQGPPTIAGLMDQLARARYDILVFLGHGDIDQPRPDLPPVSSLRLESQDGTRSDPIGARDLAQLLHDHPVPVVLLVGCLTAANFPAELQPEVERWVRGAQGVAQALLNSQSGVQCAIGTRCRIEARDAELFLHHFFLHLLKQPAVGESAIGNVEAAVREARKRLRFQSPQSLSWAAPVIFSALPAEPVFRFLNSPPTCPVAAVAPQQDARVVIWDVLSATNWGLRTASGADLAARMHAGLQRIEDELLQQVLAQHAAAVRPTRLEVPPGTLAGTLQVELRGTLAARELRGVLVAGDGDIAIREVEATPALLAAGFEAFRGRGGTEVPFFIRRGGGAAPLPEGPLLDVTVSLGPAIQAVYPVAARDLAVDPNASVCPGRNAVIVPPP